MDKYRIIKNRLLVEPMDVGPVKELKSGIITYQKEIEKMYDDGNKFGRVLVTGPDVFDVKVGDVVIFQGFIGKELLLEGANYLLMKDIDPIGIVRE